MKNWINIVAYRGYWDVPRLFMIRYGVKTILFDCPFVESQDDYSDHFTYYEIPDSLKEEEAWREIPTHKMNLLGTIRVSDLQFDETRRKQINGSFLESLV